MTMRFEFSTTSRIIFGPGTLSEIGSLVRPLGRHPMIVCGEGGANPQKLLDYLAKENLPCAIYQVSGEPTVANIQTGVITARTNRCDIVIGYGGGSVVDTAKAIGGLTPNPGDVLDYLEVIGGGQSLPGPGLKVIAIPTTAGTGAEVTRNAVIASPQHHFKASLRSSYLLPTIALVDPELTISVPPQVTASTGMDTLTQLIEPFVSIKANPLVDAFCREGIPLAAQALPRAYHHPDDREARRAMSLAALLSGLSLANAGLGAVHGFAAPIAGTYGAPHGQICARLLAATTKVNLGALKERAADQNKTDRYREIARMVMADPGATIEDLLSWLQNLTQELDIPKLGQMGIKVEDIPDIIDKAKGASSMKANPIELTTEELSKILLESI